MIVWKQKSVGSQIVSLEWNFDLLLSASTFTLVKYFLLRYRTPSVFGRCLSPESRSKSPSLFGPYWHVTRGSRATVPSWRVSLHPGRCSSSYVGIDNYIKRYFPLLSRDSGCHTRTWLICSVGQKCFCSTYLSVVFWLDTRVSSPSSIQSWTGSLPKLYDSSS